MEELQARAREAGFSPLRIGVVTRNPELVVRSPSGRKMAIDAAPFRNLLLQCKDLKEYMARFLAEGKAQNL